MVLLAISGPGRFARTRQPEWPRSHLRQGRAHRSTWHRTQRVGLTTPHNLLCSGSLMWLEMLWGGGDGMARSPPEATDGAPHATAERLEPVTHRSEPGRHLNRDHRDEPIELARRRHRPRDRAPPAEEARG